MQFKCIALCSYSIWLFNCSAKSSAHSGARAIAILFWTISTISGHP